MRINKTISVFTHVIVWLGLFSMPFLLSYGQEVDVNRVIAHFSIPLFFYAIIFYSNYFYIIDKLLFTKKIFWFILLNIAMIVFFIYSKEYIENNFFVELIKTRPTTEDGKSPPFKMILYFQMLTYTAPLLFAIVVKTTNRWIKTENERKEALNVKLKSELQHLHYQLQPHFFFNALNNIYAMVDLSPDEAKKSIHSLSKLMRYMLYETNVAEVPLSKEIDFMKKYIDLMKLRVSDKTTVLYSFPEEETNLKIAPLLFISLIENAFKHGVAANQESEIHIELTVNMDGLKFKTKNANFPKNTDDKSGSGIGIANVQKRLKLLYPDKFKFNTFIEDNYFISELIIQSGK